MCIRDSIMPSPSIVGGGGTKTIARVSVLIFLRVRQLKNPQLMAPPFKFGTVPYGSTETNLMTHYPSIYAYMRKYSKANAIEGVKAVKDGSVLVMSFNPIRVV